MPLHMNHLVTFLAIAQLFFRVVFNTSFFLSLHIAYNGTKLILFGGHEMDGISKNTTYILDVTSMEWTKGPAVDASQSRSAMACSVSGDNVVIWGGMNVVMLFTSNHTIIINWPYF